jgi:hypothetical protein
LVTYWNPLQKYGNWGFFSPPQNMANFDLFKNMKNPLNRSESYFSQVGKSKNSPPEK